jgi:prepilin-type processing-associated H-X9-DG protein
MSHTLIVGEVISSIAKPPKINFEGHSGYFWSTWDIIDTHLGINPAIVLNGYAPGVPDEEAFASYHAGGCHFVFADGHVTFISEEIGPVLLAGLSTRNSAENLTENTY